MAACMGMRKRGLLLLIHWYNCGTSWFSSVAVAVEYRLGCCVWWFDLSEALEDWNCYCCWWGMDSILVEHLSSFVALDYWLVRLSWTDNWIGQIEANGLKGELIWLTALGWSDWLNWLDWTDWVTQIDRFIDWLTYWTDWLEWTWFGLQFSTYWFNGWILRYIFFQFWSNDWALGLDQQDCNFCLLIWGQCLPALYW